MLVCGTNWETRHFTVCQQTWKSSRKRDSGLRQTFGKIDITQMTTDNFVMWVIRLSLVDWVYFPTLICWRNFEDSNSTSGRIFCIFGTRTFVTISWMCKKQTSVSFSSAESEIISLDAGLRMDGWTTCSRHLGRGD